MNRILLILVFPLLVTCGRQPQGNDTTFNHDTVAGQACSSCHEAIRPAGLEGLKHGGGGDCAKCHQPKDVTTAGGDSASSALWLPRRTFDHDGQKPTTCNECHVQERPTSASHPGKAPSDCAGCHNGNWTQGNFHG